MHRTLDAGSTERFLEPQELFLLTKDLSGLLLFNEDIGAQPQDVCKNDLFFGLIPNAKKTRAPV